MPGTGERADPGPAPAIPSCFSPLRGRRNCGSLQHPGPLDGTRFINPSLSAGAAQPHGGLAASPAPLPAAGAGPREGSGVPKAPRALAAACDVSCGRTLGLAGSKRLPPHPAPGAAPPRRPAPTLPYPSSAASTPTAASPLGRPVVMTVGPAAGRP